MPKFAAPDGTKLVYRLTGDDQPVVVVPGGPMRASSYLGDLAGFAAHRTCAVLDLRGSGASEPPVDPASYRCDRQVEDVEALREHLGLTRIALLAHSAGGSLAVRYAERHPDRVERLALITPSGRAVDLAPTPERRVASLALRADEPWYPAAAAAYDRIAAGQASAADWIAIRPMAYGRWDEAARAHEATEDAERNGEGARVFNSEGAFEPALTRAALGRLDVPVLVMAGGRDWILDPVAATDFVNLFPRAERAVLPTASHYPWLDDPIGFRAALDAFLR